MESSYTEKHKCTGSNSESSTQSITAHKLAPDKPTETGSVSSKSDQDNPSNLPPFPLDNDQVRSKEDTAEHLKCALLGRREQMNESILSSEDDNSLPPAKFLVDSNDQSEMITEEREEESFTFIDSASVSSMPAWKTHTQR